MSKNWESYVGSLDSMADADIQLGDTLAEAVNSILSDYIAGDICGFDFLCKITKAVDEAQEFVSSFEK